MLSCTRQWKCTQCTGNNNNNNNNCLECNFMLLFRSLSSYRKIHVCPIFVCGEGKCTRIPSPNEHTKKSRREPEHKIIHIHTGDQRACNAVIVVSFQFKSNTKHKIWLISFCLQLNLFRHKFDSKLNIVFETHALYWAPEWQKSEKNDFYFTRNMYANSVPSSHTL